MRMRYTRYTFILAAAAAAGIGAIALQRATGQAEAPARPVITIDKNLPDDAEAAAANDEPGQPLAAPNPTPSTPAQIGAPQAARSTPGGAPDAAAPPRTPGRGPAVPNATGPGTALPGAIPAAAGGIARERELRVIEGNGEAVYRTFVEPIAQPIPGGWGGGESDPEAVQLQAADAQMGQAADALIQQYGQTEDEQQRNNLKEQLNETLAKQFDVQQQRREHEIAKIEAKVKKLRDIITKRTDARQTIIERRLDQLLREADGLGWNSPAASAEPFRSMPMAPAPYRLPAAPGGPTRVPPGASGGTPNRFRLLNQAPAAAGAATTATPPPSRPGASVKQASAREQAKNNIKQIMLALHNYYDVNGHFPPPVLLGPDGKTPYSWRVAILPYIEQTALYNQYKLDEPWDSENNKQVLEQMPPVLRHPSADPNSKETSYLAVVGPETCFGEKNGKGTTFAEILDGTANTIMVVEAKLGVPWTKPQDTEYDAIYPSPELGGVRPTDFLAGYADGSVRALDISIDAELLRALITRAGGEKVYVAK
jgi:hypothetical protein